MDTLYLSLFMSFTEISWEGDSNLVFSFDVVSKIVFNVLGTRQLSMASIDGSTKASPSSTHYAAVGINPTLW